LHHRLFEISGEFREHASWRTSWVESGVPHGEVRGSTLGIVGYGRVGQEVARRAAPFGVRILAANRSPREAQAGVERVFPMAALGRDRRQYRPLRPRREPDQSCDDGLKGAEMKALFLGRFASGHAPRVVARLTTAPQTEILADDTDASRLAPALAEADIVVGL